MTTRERFIRTLTGKPVDRVPFMKVFGGANHVLAHWKEEHPGIEESIDELAQRTNETLDGQGQLLAQAGESTEDGQEGDGEAVAQADGDDDEDKNRKRHKRQGKQRRARNGIAIGVAVAVVAVAALFVAAMAGGL